ncbi:DoxX family protein [Paenibacillus pabuli]|uniref:DoxX family protein n=1 Tax=Paenibacillus pabuli TaxID=1472 RepID=UPI00200005C9|nr:DoxX family protein [Paenibacillus pabuli]UPK42524.1 DoxX family protein [Paenibacillus pabuli]
MNVTLWIVQIILAAGFIYSGWMKTVRIESSKTTWAWVNDVPKTLVVLIGIAELLGALGLVLPWAMDITPVLTPIAAIALAVVALLGMLFHIQRKEYREIGVNILFVVLSLIVAIGRL